MQIFSLNWMMQHISVLMSPRSPSDFTVVCFLTAAFTQVNFRHDFFIMEASTMNPDQTAMGIFSLLNQ